MTATSASASVAHRYRTLAAAFEAKVAAVRPDQWANPSPCEGWTARDVVRHVIDVHGRMLGPAGLTLGGAPSVDDDPLGAFRSARADLQQALDDPAIADTEYDGMFGRTRVADTVSRFMCFDLVVHGWDLARATGQDETMPDDEVDRILGLIEQMGTATMRDQRVVGPEVPVPADAPTQARMLGLLGRDPG